MDELLSRAGNQAVTFAIRSGISIVSGYAIRRVTRLLDKLPEDEKDSLEKVKRRLSTKIKIVTPAIDLIQLIAARGNTSLDSTVALTRALRHEINEFDERVESAGRRIAAARTADDRKRAAKSIESYMLGLLARIEDSIPLISLALTTSGANLSSSLPDTVSPSRLLQASSFLFSADTAFARSPDTRQQVGPPFALKMYTVFQGTARNPLSGAASSVQWKEEHAKCRAAVFRVPAAADGRRRPQPLRYDYALVVTEDLNDGRYHDELDRKDAPKEDADGFIGGRSREIPISIITRLFFSASGRLLEIDDAISPVLVLKLNKAFLDVSDPYGSDSSDDETSFASARADSDSDEYDFDGDDEEIERQMLHSRVENPSNIEWLAFEMWADPADEDEFAEASDGDDDDDDEAADGADGADATAELSRKSLVAAFSSLQLNSAELDGMLGPRPDAGAALRAQQQRSLLLQPADIASLSLLEYIIRLSALQTNDQQSSLLISDERISLYLRDENAATVPQTPRTPASSRAGPDAALTPWELDRLRPGVDDSPLDKFRRRR
ncbi:RanGTP-binding protein-domain-containing protein [Dipodascopsis tothii]|uniref:RanGTP-binding protein-domain-containing protein n=1 Tax=Dipodascopsis tothii TaxID=44089 RepID=UPI0034CDE96E